MSDKDSFGYMYVDNKDPSPKIEYKWIDAIEDGDKITISGDDSYGTVPVQFSFPFYGNTYTTVYPSTNGLLGVGGAITTYSNTNIPTTSPNSFIAPYWDDLSMVYGGSVYYSTGSSQYGVEYVCIEWVDIECPLYSQGPNYAITFEVILYKDGMIKMQYLDVTSQSNGNGQSATVGIDSPNGQEGVQYSANIASLTEGLAIMFGSSIAEVKSVDLETEEGGAFYALHKDYTVTTVVTHPINTDMLKQVSLTFGNDLATAFSLLSEGGALFTMSDPAGFIMLNPSGCSVKKIGSDLEVVFSFSPTFNFPVSTFQDLTVSTGGIGVMPNTQVLEDIFWVENRLDLTGSLTAVSDSIGLIENGGWVKAGEEFFFRGVRVVYPETAFSPRAGAVTLTVSDELGNTWVQKEVDATADVKVAAESGFIRKTYTLNITGIPDGVDISELPSYVLNIDPYKPTPPKEVLIHADSFVDRNTEFDDDNEVFVSWEPSEDFESGVVGYFVSFIDPFDATATGPDPVFVESPDTSSRLVLEGMGSRKVWVWAVDRAGNPSIPSFAITKIDAEEVTFSEFSPGNRIWVNTDTPVCSVLIDDMEGSGVSAKDLQYSISQTNVLEYGAWQTSSIGRNAEEIRLSVKAQFSNGKNNWIRFRAKDVAGNGWTYSQDYNVWVDEERPSYVNFRPFEVEYQNGENVVVSVDITDIHSSRDGSGIDLDTMNYRISTQGTGLFGDWLEAPVSTIDRNGVVHIEMELKFKEGTDNYIQFRCNDNVGNFATSKEYNILVNSAPIVKAFLSEPKNGHTYTTSEKLLFDATGTTDPDGDDLGYLWYSDINGFLSASDSFFRTLSPGVHRITVVVNDPAHSVVKEFDVEVLEEMQIDPEEIDTDGDGIYDDWELKYGLDPKRPDSFIDADKDKFTNLQEFQNGTDPIRSVSHPPYDVFEERKDPTKVDMSTDQYRSITLALGLMALLLVFILLLLAFSKYRNFKVEREEEKELEVDEKEYRKALDRK